MAHSSSLQERGFNISKREFRDAVKLQHQYVCVEKTSDWTTQ